jgi:hypothetical protein
VVIPPVDPALPSMTARLLLLLAGLMICAASGAMITMQMARGDTMIDRASRIAKATGLVAVVALGAALFV